MRNKLHSDLLDDCNCSFARNRLLPLSNIQGETIDNLAYSYKIDYDNICNLHLVKWPVQLNSSCLQRARQSTSEWAKESLSLISYPIYFTQKEIEITRGDFTLYNNLLEPRYRASRDQLLRNIRLMTFADAPGALCQFGDLRRTSDSAGDIEVTLLRSRRNSISFLCDSIGDTFRVFEEDSPITSNGKCAIMLVDVNISRGTGESRCVTLRLDSTLEGEVKNISSGDWLHCENFVINSFAHTPFSGLPNIIDDKGSIHGIDSTNFPEWRSHVSCHKELGRDCIFEAIDAIEAATETKSKRLKVVLNDEHRELCQEIFASNRTDNLIYEVCGYPIEFCFEQYCPTNVVFILDSSNIAYLENGLFEWNTSPLENKFWTPIYNKKTADRQYFNALIKYIAIGVSQRNAHAKLLIA